MDNQKQNANNAELIEALKLDDDEQITRKPSGSSDLKGKMRKILMLIIVFIVLLIVVVWLLSLVSGKKQSYKDIESTMKKAAEKYYSNHKGELPAEDKATSEVSLQKLINGKYMKDISSYKSGSGSCSGKVVVENNDDEYLYISYLDCGEKYTTTELFREITKEENVVTEDSGLYYMNGEYVFRGEDVNNFVKIDENIWRIVKVDKNNEVVLILDEPYVNVKNWDNRYNTARKMSYGYNDYKKSRLREYNEAIYEASKNNDTSEYKKLLLSEKMVKYLSGYNLCYGNRAATDSTNDNSIECKNVLENTKVGALTLSDFINASTDPECKTATSKSCQNYNYLITNKKTFWLITGNTVNSYEVYRVNQYGKLESIQASSYSSIRPVIHLNSKTMFNSGTGEEVNPYTIK